MRLVLTVAALAACVSSPLQAQTGGELFKLYTGGVKEQMVCDLYITGFVHGMQAAQDLSGTVCLPPGLTGAEASEIFVTTLRELQKSGKDIRTNPFFARDQRLSVAAALHMRFPCPKTEKSRE